MYSFQELAASFEEKFAASLPFPAFPAGLYEPCSYFSTLGGKRVRPVLCLMANELFAPITDDAWHAAFAVELFHNFTLIHDDIMDKAPLRRGKQTLHDKYGTTAGILCGDVMSIYAYKSLANVTTNLKAVFDVFNTTAIQVCEGQQLDMDFEQRDDVTVEEYLQMIELKTSVLLACSLKIGALAAGGLGNNANRLYEFGKNLGIAFQLQDDYLDAYGDPDKLGKQRGGDILANKKTYLLVQAMLNNDVSIKHRIQELLQTTADDKVDAMVQLYAETGADSACLEAVQHYSSIAFANLDELAIPSVRKEPLKQLAVYLLNRDR